MNGTVHQQIRESLAEAAIYPDGGPVEICETHISVVFLTAAHAWKLLKPVTFDFLDFSTVESRLTECRNEVRLNQRLAADVYLGVVPVTRTTEGFSIDGDGEPVDWLIKMRRLPDEVTLDAKIKSGQATTADLDRVLDMLQPFFERAETGPEIDTGGEVAVVRRNLVGSLDVLDRNSELENSVYLRSMQLQFLATRGDLFRQRITEGWIRDVHGDLRAEHIYLTDPPVIVDCIAFNDRFRHVDLLDEICFLATDLHRLGRDDLAASVIDRYRRRMNDTAPAALAEFFQSYRFAVRAKVACLRAAEGGRTDPELDSLCEAADLLEESIAVLKPSHRPYLIVFCGVSGSGKSTIARALATEIGAFHLPSDVVRKYLYGVAIDDHTAHPELYTPEVNARTYDQMRQRAEVMLSRGCSVILDATFQRADDRHAVRKLSEELDLPLLFVHCEVSTSVAMKRIAEREERGGDASDANQDVLKSQLAKFEPPVEIPAGQLVSIDASLPIRKNCDQIVSRLRVV